MSISRRHFMVGTALTTSALAIPTFLRAADKPKVVVIGGGAGGATAARYIAKDSKGAIDVTLIEPQQAFTTCFFSNLYIGGFRTFESITHDYRTLEGTHGIKVVHQMATGVDKAAKTVTLADGSSVPYDKLIVSPGISLKWDSFPGYTKDASEVMPHAWQAGPQTQLLKSKVDGMKEGGTFVMVAPPNPYRCPPGPYERVSMIAHVFKQKNPKAKIIVLDPKEKFSKQGLFQAGWEQHYPGMVEWIPASIHGGIKSVDVATGEIKTDLDTFKSDAANIIPAQAAGEIAATAGLTNDTGFCPIVPGSMQSQADPNVYVLGDSTIAGDMPKSGYSANSQAKVCANAVRGELTGSKVFPAKFSNTCWSLIATNDGVKVGASYEAKPDKITSTGGFVSKTGEDAALRKATFEESVGWYAGIANDIFGA
ncbi:MAG: NAD(P)/FAD-dependent oxidoreductase [Alphaproteobacteria bacterium]|nr:NAD(P)/FAD-dependent oxidoreductase [Alphaproteobacteria bacterium]